jgi:predicted TIM-barrel fold metal-dependent hydrolase
VPAPPGLQLVDSHVHLWDLSANPWYPAVQQIPDGSAWEEELGDLSALRRDYLPADYRADSADVDVLAVVHVSAVSAPRRAADEGRWLDTLADREGLPTVVIGAVDADLAPAQIEEDLEAQAASARFRGARVLTGLDPSSEQAATLCRWLDGRGWVFDAVVHPAQARDYRALLERFPTLRVVLEHTLWPEGTDPDQVAAWRAALVELAALPNVACKVSGLPMVVHSMRVDALRPWIEGAIDAFGPDRCLFGSNFLVDGLYGPFEALVAAYVEVTEGLTTNEREWFFVRNAESLYRL